MKYGIWQALRRWSRLSVAGMMAVLILLALFSLPKSALAENPPSQPFDLVFEAVGEKVGAVQDGAGMFGRTEGNVTIDVPGVSIRKAYLIWSGLGRDNNGILFGAADGSTPQRIIPGWTWNNDTYGSRTWGCCGGELSAYAADITDLDIVQPGQNSYTVSDMSIEHAGVEENWGYSLVVVYEDPTLETVNDVIVKLGNDGFHFRWSGMLGPNSDVQCVAVPRADQDRTMSFVAVVGGISDIYRPNGLWGRTGNEDYVNMDEDRGTWNQSLGLIDGVSGITGIGGSTEIDGPLDGDWTDNGVDWPFTDNRGDQWDLYPVIEIPLDSGDTWACVQIESANRPEIPAGPGTFQLGASIGFMGLFAIFESHEQPEIDIEKATNGEDADEPTGPVVVVGEPVTWTFEVTNIGDEVLVDVAVTDDLEGDIVCPKDSLAPDESMTCVETGIATAGQYANMATVVGKNGSGVIVTDMDPSHYLGISPAIDIEKATNGEDADEPTGPVVTVGEIVTWTFEVTNIGDEALVDVAVNDDLEGDIVCPKDSLAPDESMTCAETGIAVTGQYANMATVVGKNSSGVTVTDKDPSHYLGVNPAIDIEKYTNGEDADDEADAVVIDFGAPVTWTYVVTNIGDVTLSDVIVTDDRGVAVTCPRNTLTPDEAMTCVGTGTAGAGLYKNNGTVTGRAPDGTIVTDTDPSHYTNVPTGIDAPEPGAPSQRQEIYLPLLTVG